MLLVQKGGGSNYNVKEQLVGVQNRQTARHFNVLPSSNRSDTVAASNQHVLLAGRTAGNTCGLTHPTDESLVDLQSRLTLYIKMINLAELTERWSARVPV